MGQFRKGESFSTHGDDGRIHLVTTWVEFVDHAEGLAGRPQWEPSGFECLRMEDGRAVHELPDGSFDVASSGVMLRRARGAVEADAPWESAEEEAFTSEGGHVAGTKTPASGPADERLMASHGISLADGEYVFAAFRYERLADAVAYATSEQSGLAG